MTGPGADGPPRERRSPNRSGEPQQPEGANDRQRVDTTDVQDTVSRQEPDGMADAIREAVNMMAAEAVSAGVALSAEPLAGNDASDNWRVNAPMLYDLFVGVNLDWPALSVTWLPDEPNEGCRLAIGTHTDGSSKSEVLVAELMAAVDQTLDVGDPWKSWGHQDGFGSVEGFGCSASGDVFNVVARLAHPTEVNRVVACPYRAQLLATKAANGTVYLFDYKAERQAGQVCPDATLTFASADGQGSEGVDGFALEWSPAGQHLLASGGHDGRLGVWDVNSSSLRAGGVLLHSIDAHEGALNAVAFSRAKSSILGSVGDDRKFRLWDLRAGACGAARAQATLQVSESNVHTVDWSHHSEHVFATGGKDKELRIWDFRSTAAPLHVLQGHKDDIDVVRWAPFRQGLLTSCSSDQRAHLWDLTAERKGDSNPTDNGADEDKDPDVSNELFFAHGGHTQKVTDISWSDADDYLVCSVAEDNSLHIWQPSTVFYLDDSEAEADAGEAPSKRSRVDSGDLDVGKS